MNQESKVNPEQTEHRTNKYTNRKAQLILWKALISRVICGSYFNRIGTKLMNSTKKRNRIRKTVKKEGRLSWFWLQKVNIRIGSNRIISNKGRLTNTIKIIGKTIITTKRRKTGNNNNSKGHNKDNNSSNRGIIKRQSMFQEMLYEIIIICLTIF